MEGKIINLNESLFVGKGTHKKCYRHPEAKGKCIKMAYSSYGQKDLDRELAYLKIISTSGGDYSVLPRYYGPVQTNLGVGHVYEFITNYDGSSCETFEDYCVSNAMLENNLDMLIEVLTMLKYQLLTNNIISMGIFPENILIQKVDNEKRVKVRMVNDIGSAALIPLEYYFDFVAKIRVRKRWKRFMKYLLDEYGEHPAMIKLVKELL